MAPFCHKFIVSTTLASYHFQPLEFKPSPLSNTEIDEYLLALKQEFRGGMRDSPFFIKANVKNKGLLNLFI